MEMETEAEQGSVGSQMGSLKQMSLFPKGSSPALRKSWFASFPCFPSGSCDPESPQMTSEEAPEKVPSQVLYDGEGDYNFNSHFTESLFLCLQVGKSPLTSPHLHCSPSLTHTEEMCRAK